MRLPSAIPIPKLNLLLSDADFNCSKSDFFIFIDALKACLESIPNEGVFYETPQWAKLRYETLKKYRKCCLCGSTENLHVDHIQPRSLYPALELDAENMQVLCQRCNLAKSNKDEEDYR